MEQYELPIDLKSAREQFDAAQRLSQRVYGQNVRSEGLEEIDDTDFYEIARESLSAEQRDTISELRVLTSQAPYEELVRVERELADRLDAATKALTEAEEELNHAFEKIDRNAGLAQQIAPRAAEIIAEKVVVKKRQAQLELTGVDSAALVSMQHQYDGVTDLYSRAGEAWPVPRLWHFGAIVATTEETPVIPETASTEAVIEPEATEDPFEMFRRRQGFERPTLPHHVAFYFLQHPGEIISIDDLGTHLVQRGFTSAGDERQLRNRVSTMLGPFGKGLRIRRMLADEGLVLQYGTQTLLRDDGRPVQGKTGPSRRAYRAISASDPEADAGQTFVAQVPTLPRTEESAENLEDVTADNSALETSIDWREALYEKVAVAIGTLAADGLMKDEAVQAKVARAKSSSKRIGTREAVSRLVKLRLMDNTQIKNPDVAELMPRELVLMHVENSTPQLSLRSGRTIQREAENIVIDAIGAYFEEQRKKERRAQQ